MHAYCTDTKSLLNQTLAVGDEMTFHLLLSPVDRNGIYIYHTVLCLLGCRFCCCCCVLNKACGVAFDNYHSQDWTRTSSSRRAYRTKRKQQQIIRLTHSAELRYRKRLAVNTTNIAITHIPYSL